MGKAELPLHAPGTQTDRGYIGQSVPRANAQRLLQGRGAYVDDLRFPRLAHVVFFRSPYAHALIKRLDFSRGLKSAGVIDMEESLTGKRLIHKEFEDNICFARTHDTGGVDEAFGAADLVVEETFHFGRHTGVCLETRSILADYNAAEHSLTVYHSTQAPHMMQDIFSRHLNIPEANVRVITKDVGGSYGIKVHVYADEMATAALSVMLRRPVKFVADRLESFVSDIHAREHKARVRLACTRSGEILAFELDDLTAIGPYSVYPRTSGIEGNQVVNLTGGPYRHQKYRAKR